MTSAAVTLATLTIGFFHLLGANLRLCSEGTPDTTPGTGVLPDTDGRSFKRVIDYVSARTNSKNLWGRLCQRL